MPGGSWTIGVLVRGFNSLSAPLLKAEHSLASFRKTAEATAIAINTKLAAPKDIDTDAVDEAKDKLTGLGTKAMVAGGLMAAGLGLASREAVTFQSAMTHVSTLVDTSTTDMNYLSESVRSLSREIGAAPAETAKTLAEIIKGGFREAGAATKVLEGSMRLADASFGDMKETASSLTAIMNAYGLKASKVTSVSDQLITAANMGRTSVGELADSMRKITPLASKAGVGLDELLSATSALSGVMHTGEAVMSLRGVLAALNDPGKEAAETARSLGIDFSAAAVKSMGLAKWLEDVKEKTGGSEEALTKLFGPVKVLQGVFALTGSQAKSYAGILEKVKNSTGATATAFEKVDATAGDALGDAKANVQDLMISMGNVLLPAVGKLAGLIKGAAGALSVFTEQHPMLSKVGIVLTAVTAGVLILGGVALIMGAQVMSAMAMVNVSTGGVLLVVGALITGITALVMWWTSGTDTMKGASGLLATAWGYLKTAFYAVAIPIAWGLGFLVGTLTKAWNTVASYTAEVWPMVKQVVLDAWNAITTILSPQIAAFTGMFVFAWESIKVVTSSVWEAIKLTVTTAWSMVYNSIALVWNLISGVFKAGLQILTGDWSGAWETIQGTFTNVWENIKGIFGAWIGWFIGLSDIFRNAGMGLINAFWEGIQAAWGTLKEGFTGLLDGLRSLLPFSDAKEGPLSQLTKSGQSLLPTFARGIERNADEPYRVVAESLSTIRLEPPVIPPVAFEQTAKGSSSENLNNSSGSNPSVVFQRGSIQVSVSGGGALENLEERLTEIFSRASLRLGVSHA